MERAAAVRVSTNEQATEGVSPDAQEDRLRAYCRLQGLELAVLVREGGISTSKPLPSARAGRSC
ncbi:resolvase [Limnochorda pilosa]|uniref:Resolvase n=1 Tax=Limnochorda pilosa TaxID=1555112 RepID=A0A0K2SPI7_LIMPI|nr:resolvase [Limnochorda pilosa]